MKNKRKGFDFLKFIIIYGWVILIVLLAIGALAYFGVFDSLQTKIICHQNPKKCVYEPNEKFFNQYPSAR